MIVLVVPSWRRHIQMRSGTVYGTCPDLGIRVSCVGPGLMIVCEIQGCPPTAGMYSDSFV